MANNGDEYWSRFNVVFSLIQFWQATGDSRIMPTLFRFLTEMRNRLLNVQVCVLTPAK
jgi:hypothetical protein